MAEKKTIQTVISNIKAQSVQKELFNYCIKEIDYCDDEMYQSNLAPCKFLEF